MYHPNVGLLWAVNDGNKWKISQNSKKIGYSNSLNYITHGDIFRISFEKGINDMPHEIGDFITGRIKPDGTEIYIHNIGSRYGDSAVMDTKKYNKWTNKAVDLIYKYMGDYIE